ncbi:hypothetical protein ACLVWU_06275 [Bdellovibrio sp. HCB290]|uniref:hypothetical protein n=1 Tax=Bdellovibrio sp. HCB290 TaxID=3394356 RepID=UPI0039B5459B
MLSSLILFLTAPIFAASLTCQTGSFRMPYDGATKVVKAQTYCFNEDRTELYSKDCQSRKCSAFNLEIQVKMADLLNESSNPGFNLCRKLGGKPELLQFEASAEWFALDRFNFKDGAFVSTGELMRHYLHKPNRLSIDHILNGRYNLAAFLQI